MTEMRITTSNRLRIPVTIVTGFLGSGKTSLINKLLRHSAFSDSAIVVNEFGDVGLDHSLIATAQDNIILLEGGCLCCTVAESLRETLADLYHRRAVGSVPPFARLIIETSGMADPAPIIQMLTKDTLIAPLFSYAGTICVVDSYHMGAQIQDHAEMRAQVVLADCLMLGKEDLVKDSRDNIAVLRQLNPLAEIRHHPTDDDLADFLKFKPVSAAELPQDHQHAHTHGVTTHSFTIETAVSWAGVSAWAEHMRALWGDDLLRSKALLRMKDGRLVVIHGVRKIFNTNVIQEPSDPEAIGRLVCIGTNLDRDRLEQGLNWLFTPEGVHIPASSGFAPWGRT